MFINTSPDLRSIGLKKKKKKKTFSVSKLTTYNNNNLLRIMWMLTHLQFDRIYSLKNKSGDGRII